MSISFIPYQTLIDKQVKEKKKKAKGEKYHLLTVAAGNKGKKIKERLYFFYIKIFYSPGSQLNVEFQRIARRDKKPLREQCKEIEEKQ